MTWRDGWFADVERRRSRPTTLADHLAADGVELRPRDSVAEVCLAAARLARARRPRASAGGLAARHRLRARRPRSCTAPRRLAGTLLTYRGHAVDDDSFDAVGRPGPHGPRRPHRAGAGGRERRAASRPARRRRRASSPRSASASCSPSSAGSPTRGRSAYVEARASVARLLDPRHLGAFRVLAWSRGGRRRRAACPGSRLAADRRATLSGGAHRRGPRPPRATPGPPSPRWPRRLDPVLLGPERPRPGATLRRRPGCATPASARVATPPRSCCSTPGPTARPTVVLTVRPAGDHVHAGQVALPGRQARARRRLPRRHGAPRGGRGGRPRRAGGRRDACSGRSRSSTSAYRGSCMVPVLAVAERRAASCTPHAREVAAHPARARARASCPMRPIEIVEEDRDGLAHPLRRVSRRRAIASGARPPACSASSGPSSRPTDRLARRDRELGRLTGSRDRARSALPGLPFGRVVLVGRRPAAGARRPRAPARRRLVGHDRPRRSSPAPAARTSARPRRARRRSRASPSRRSRRRG